MKVGKRITAVILMLVMLVSVMPVARAGAETQTSATTEPLIVRFRIYSPYHTYYDTVEGDTYSYYSIKFETEADVEAVLKDDFGIGLKNDGTPDVVEDGKGYMSVLRALAYRIRLNVIRDNWDKWFPESTSIGQKEHIDEANQKANAIMKNYIKVTDSAYGKYLEALSEDGKNWNVGLVKTGTSPYTAGWMYYVNVNAAMVSMDAYPVKGNDRIDLSLGAYGSDTCIAAWDYNDNYVNYIPEEKKTTRLRVLRETYDEKGEKVYSPLPGAVVKDFAQNKEGLYVWTGETLTSDAEGYIDFKADESGIHYLAAIEEYDDGKGNVYTKTDVGLVEVVVIRKTPKAEQVKAKVKGKKKAKKKNIVVSFAVSEVAYAKKNTDYNIYLSKKKKSGYKKVATTDGTKLKATIKNKKKGTYYVKVQAVMNLAYDKDAEGNLLYKQFKSDFTSPKKVVIK